MAILGIDLGGTKISSVLFDENFNELDSSLVSTESQAGVERVLEQLVDIITHQRECVTKVGIGVPGPTLHGEVHHFANIQGEIKVNFADYLSTKTGIPVTIENDANAFLVGAWRQSEYAHKKNVIGITLGTGVGGAIIIDGKLYRGSHGGGGEIGHMPFINNKTVEQTISGSALKYHWFNKFGTSKNGKQIQDAAEEGGVDEMNFLHEVAQNLGLHILQLLHIFDPDVVFIGGSAARTYKMYEAVVKDVFKQSVFPHLAQIPIVALSELNAAPYGAAWLAKQSK